MIKMNKTIHELTGSNRKKSILKSMFVTEQVFENDFTNTKISIEPYDQTFLNVEQRNGSDYILDQLQKQLNKTNVINQIESYLKQKINNIRIGYYSDNEYFETVFIQKNNKFMWQSEAYNW